MSSRTERVQLALSFVALAVVWGVAAGGIFWLMDKGKQWVFGEDDYERDCIKYSIEASGYNACDANSACNLGDYELLARYQSNKNALMACARADAKEAREAWAQGRAKRRAGRGT